MSVIVNNSITLDGFISGLNHYEDWISGADQSYFEQACADADIIIMGSATFDSNDDLYPIPDKENIVFAQNANERKLTAGITFTNQDPVNFVREHSDKKLLVAGGGKLNATLLKSGVVTDIVVCIHPVILGSGVRQFEGINMSTETRLTKVSEEDIGDGVIKIHYRVN